MVAGFAYAVHPPPEVSTAPLTFTASALPNQQISVASSAEVAVR